MRLSKTFLRALGLVGICAAVAVLTPVAQPRPDAGAQAATGARVTAVDVNVVPPTYSGPCPDAVRLVGTITTNGPGTAYYDFQAGAIGASRQGTIAFSAAGTKRVTSEGELRRTPEVRTVRFLAGMEPRGHQENAKYVDTPLDMTCAGGAEPAGRGRVTGVTVARTPLGVVTGKCPASFHFVATITTDGPAEVRYIWNWSDGSKGPEGSVKFTAAGSRRVDQDWTFGAAGHEYHEWGLLKILSPNPILSNKDAVILSCR